MVNTNMINLAVFIDLKKQFSLEFKVELINFAKTLVTSVNADKIMNNSSECSLFKDRLC